MGCYFSGLSIKLPASSLHYANSQVIEADATGLDPEAVDCKLNLPIDRVSLLTNAVYFPYDFNYRYQIYR